VRGSQIVSHLQGAGYFKTVHRLFTSLPSRPASGLRLETRRNVDKKKSEFYFSTPLKKILTEKRNGAFPNLPRAVDQRGAFLHFPRFRAGARDLKICADFDKSFQEPIHPRVRNRRGVFSFFDSVILMMGFVLMANLFVPRSARGADELLPPFGFRWNDSMPRVEAVLNGAKARIVAREKKENREVWTVEGLIHPGLKRTLFTFKQGSLYGVELQYEYPDRTIEWYNQRMGEIRRYFDAKFGTGKLVSRSRDTDSDVIQTLVGYQWMVGTTMLELFYFSAERGADLYRTISVDYKAL
jgi:hypothetical protein